MLGAPCRARDALPTAELEIVDRPELGYRIAALTGADRPQVDSFGRRFSVSTAFQLLNLDFQADDTVQNIELSKLVAGALLAPAGLARAPGAAGLAYDVHRKSSYRTMYGGVTPPASPAQPPSVSP